MPKFQTIVQKTTMALAVVLVAAALGREAMVLLDTDYEPDTSDVTDARAVPPPASFSPQLSTPLQAPKE